MIGSPQRLALFNVGLRSTSGEVVYHLAHKLADFDERVLVVDCDFEAGVTESFLGEKGLFEVWAGDSPSIVPIQLTERLFLVPGDPRLSLRTSTTVDLLARNFEQRIEEAARHNECSWILFSLGTPLASWTYTALGAVRRVAVVVASQPRSLRALAVAGDLLRSVPTNATEAAPPPDLVGYIVQHPVQKVFGPAEIYAACLARLPAAYRTAFDLRSRPVPRLPAEDGLCLGQIERPAGLYELAREVGKPAFQLRSADGASESLLHAALEADRIYETLAVRLKGRV